MPEMAACIAWLLTWLFHILFGSEEDACPAFRVAASPVGLMFVSLLCDCGKQAAAGWCTTLHDQQLCAELLSHAAAVHRQAS